MKKKLYFFEKTPCIDILGYGIMRSLEMDLREMGNGFVFCEHSE